MIQVNEEQLLQAVELLYEHAQGLSWTIWQKENGTIEVRGQVTGALRRVPQIMAHGKSLAECLLDWKQKLDQREAKQQTAIKAACKNGQQRCFECRDFACCDNQNPESKSKRGSTAVDMASDRKCTKCGHTGQVTCSVHESSDGAYEDWRYTCQACGHVWWIDGIDS